MNTPIAACCRILCVSRPTSSVLSFVRSQCPWTSMSRSVPRLRCQRQVQVGPALSEIDIQSKILFNEVNFELSRQINIAEIEMQCLCDLKIFWEFG